VDIELNLNSETVDQAGLEHAVCVQTTVPVREAFGLLKSQNAGSLLVCRGDALVGIFTERDALRLMASGESLDVPIEQVMVRQPTTLRADATVGQAIRTMFEGGYRRLPIMDCNGRVAGMIKVSGIVRYLVEHFPKSVYNLPPSPDTVLQEREGP